jgi:hypothetical protein
LRRAVELTGGDVDLAKVRRALRATTWGPAVVREAHKLDAAARVLAEAKRPMGVKKIVEVARASSLSLTGTTAGCIGSK